MRFLLPSQSQCCLATFCSVFVCVEVKGSGHPVAFIFEQASLVMYGKVLCGLHLLPISRASTYVWQGAERPPPLPMTADSTTCDDAAVASRSSPRIPTYYYRCRPEHHHIQH